MPQPPAQSSGNILKAVNSVTDMPITPPARPRRFRLPRLARRTKIVLGVLGGILLLLLIAGLASAYPLFRLKRDLPQIEASLRDTIAVAKSQDLGAAKTNLAQARTEIESAQNHFRLLSWHKFTPFRAYYLDGEHAFAAALTGLDAGDTLLSAVEPYADVLGFAGEGSFTGGTAQDRILKIIETLGKVTPEVEKVIDQLGQIEFHLDQIDPNRYPFQLRGHDVSQLIAQAQDTTSDTKESLASFTPILEVLPQIAGADASKKYLVIFQNDAELRPTGGFMTAYGVIKVDKGTVTQEKSDDIYELDQKFNSRLKPPEAIQKYLPLVYYWYLRDMNLSPDFKLSMDTFMEHYQKLPGEPKDLDGIIAVDTQLLTNLIRVLGPIDVPGFGTFTADIDARCDCPQVIYELEDFATRPVAYVRDDRKAFLVPMMQTLILKAYSAPSSSWPNLFQTVIRDIQQKHVILYMFDPTAQQAVELANFGGRLTDFSGDYLHINDTNFGGAKSNLFIQEEIEDAITTTGSGTSHVLTVTYKNPAPASNCNLEAGQLCLNGTYRDWVRFYLPKGTTLEESIGFAQDSVATYEELDKMVVEGFFEFQPKSQAKLRLTYTTPYVPQGDYKYLIQKQPGKKAPRYTLKFNDIDKQEFDLISDKTAIFRP